VQVICWQVIMMLKIFHSAQYFSKSSAIRPNNKVLPMDGFSYVMVRVAGRFEIFTEMQKSRLSLFEFGNRFLS
jgi:hypothetical protein